MGDVVRIMKKRFLRLLVTLVLVISLAGCGIKSEDLPGARDRIAGLELVHIDGYLYYDTKTNIVYIWNGFINFQASTVPSPYYASNGIPYKYDPNTKQLKEIVNDG